VSARPPIDPIDPINPARPSWASQRAAIARRLARLGVASPDAEARWLTETASGYEGVDWLSICEQAPHAVAQAHLDAMVERRLRGEPLQYALGSWSFRQLDLLVDSRVLIPRPETEWVVEIALDEAVRFGLRRGGRAPVLADGPQALDLLVASPAAVVADLGTGSGAIALALAAELPDVLVWATDVSSEALVVAGANLAGCGATRVRLAEGSWFAALPETLRGELALVVANPPYVAASEIDALPPEVARHEPRDALVSGPTGLEAIEEIVSAAPQWLAPGASLVVELAPQRSEAALALATAAGFAEAFVRDDLAGRPRVLVARSRPK
jgi:release factor glutamine methyltransferase